MPQRSFLLIFLLLFSFVAQAERLAVKAKALIQGKILYIQVEVPPGSHVYSVALEEGLGPVGTKVFIEPGLEVSPEDMTETPPKPIMDQAFGLTLQAHEGNFEIIVRLAQPAPKGLKGYLLYQICDNRICSLPQTAPFQAR